MQIRLRSTEDFKVLCLRGVGTLKFDSENLQKPGAQTSGLFSFYGGAFITQVFIADPPQLDWVEPRRSAEHMRNMLKCSDLQPTEFVRKILQPFFRGFLRIQIQNHCDFEGLDLLFELLRTRLRS